MSRPVSQLRRARHRLPAAVVAGARSPSTPAQAVRPAISVAEAVVRDREEQAARPAPEPEAVREEWVIPVTSEVELVRAVPARGKLVAALPAAGPSLEAAAADRAAAAKAVPAARRVL